MSPPNDVLCGSWRPPLSTPPLSTPPLSAPPLSTAPRSRSGEYLRRELRALVIDDDAVVARTFQRILLNFGVDATHASSTEEGIRLLSTLPAERRPNIMFLDVVMPGLNGGAFISALRTMPHLSSVPIILVSSINLTTLRDCAQQWGADGFIQKSKGLLQLEVAFDQWVRYAFDRAG